MVHGSEILEEAKRRQSHSQRSWCFRTPHSSGHQFDYFLDTNSTLGHIQAEEPAEALQSGQAKDVSCDVAKPKRAHLSEG